MKALRWYARKDLRYEDMPEPSPGPGQVKIKISMVGICGSDLKQYYAGPIGMDLEKVPLALGHEFSGRIVELGEGVTDFKVGERVTGVGYWRCGECYYCQRAMYNLCLKRDAIGHNVDGCMAEYFVAPGKSLFKLPDSVSDEAAALVEPLSVAAHAIRRGNVRTGDTVAIVGDGTIGICALLVARAAGASAVYVVSKHKGRGEVASAMGATAVIHLDDGDPVQLIGSLTGGLGADVSFECVGHPEIPQLAVALTRQGGTVVIMGLFDKPSSFDFNSLTFSEKTLVGSSIFIDEAKATIAMLADGRIDVSHLITSKVPLKDAVKMGFEKLLADKETNIKVLLEIP